jgi:hypothetical protein
MSDFAKWKHMAKTLAKRVSNVEDRANIMRHEATDVY